MKIEVVVGQQEKLAADVAIVPVFEEKIADRKEIGWRFDQVLDGKLSTLLREGDFDGKLNKTFILPTHAEAKAQRVMLVGCGKRKEWTQDRLRQVTASALKAAQGLPIRQGRLTASFAVETTEQLVREAQAIAEGALMGLYKFDRFKSKSEENQHTEIESLRLTTPSHQAKKLTEHGVWRGRIVAESVNLARDWINSPANELTPTKLAEEAQQAAEAVRAKCTILPKEKMVSLGMGGVIAVAQGSNNPPQLIIVEYTGRPQFKHAHLAFVGKGVTFDSGGISIKPAERMEHMKYDMAGGAACLGAVRAIAALKLPINVVAVVPAVENLPSGTATRPGDVVRMYNGKTVEIINTDAEGRMILGDALAYAKKFQPEAMVDCATLTGACIVALGHHAIGLMGNDRLLLDRVKESGEAVWERVWELPLWREYAEQLKSEIADLKNVGNRAAGTITGGYFLSEFAKGTPWAHLDIAGTAWAEKDSPYRPKGASGVGVRLLVELATQWPQRKR